MRPAFEPYPPPPPGISPTSRRRWGGEDNSSDSPDVPRRDPGRREVQREEDRHYREVSGWPGAREVSLGLREEDAVLCVHPFRDGNGRASRLPLLLTCYHLGIEVGRCISLERLIEEKKEGYYETLEERSRGWHQGKHDPWPYVNYLLYILKCAYREFEERFEALPARKGEKRGIVLRAIRDQTGPFRLADVERAAPGVGREWIRKILLGLKSDGLVSCKGKGPGARWSVKNKGRIPKY